MGILDSFIKKNETIVIAAPGLPKDIRRGPGGGFEKQPAFDFPEIKVNPEIPEAQKPIVTEDKSPISPAVQSLFNMGSRDIDEALKRLQFISERVSGLESSTNGEFDLLTLKVSLENCYTALSEISSYFKDGAFGKLHLKLSQAQMPQAIITVGEYLKDAMIVLEELYKTMKVLYNQAANKLSPSEEDVRTLLWETTYAFQIIRDSHNSLRKQYKNLFEGEKPEIEKPEAPKPPPKPDELELQPNAPKEITIPEYEFDGPSAPAAPGPKVDLGPEPVQETPVVEPEKPAKPKPQNKPTPKVTLDNEPEAQTTEPEWKDVAIQENSQEFNNVLTMMSPQLSKSFNKWLLDERSPPDVIYPVNNATWIQVVKSGNKIIKYRTLNKQQFDMIQENLR